MEKLRAAELERVVASERRQLHERDLDTSSIVRENENLKGEIERFKNRIQSLQNHIDSLQKFNSGGAA